MFHVLDGLYMIFQILDRFLSYNRLLYYLHNQVNTQAINKLLQLERKLKNYFGISYR